MKLRGPDAVVKRLRQRHADTLCWLVGHRAPRWSKGKLVCRRCRRTLVEVRKAT